VTARIATGTAVAACFVIAATAVTPAAPEPKRTQAASIDQLWRDPGNIAGRDVFHGEGGARFLPPVKDEFKVTGLDTAGFSGGYDVVDAAGRKWDVKTGLESQSEIVASRVLWAIGYHQPVMHFVPEWTIEGKGKAPSVGRFRLADDHKVEGEWDWNENPFVGTREFKGLVVANLVLNNWDIKASNNRIYVMPKGVTPARRYVVQDVGAALGRTGWPTGTRSNVEHFEQQRLVERVEGSRVIFDYRARHKELLEDITPADVVWTCRLLDQITDKQWKDIFRAASYPSATGERFRVHLKAKIAEGLALASNARRPS
jgi:hypothetical protein